MYRILDTEIRKVGLLENRLNVVYGVGSNRVKYVLRLFGVANYLSLVHINKYYFEAVKQILLNSYFVDKRLRYFVKEVLMKYKQVRSYRGIRISEGLPVRGQTTRSNGKTSRKMVKVFNI